MMEINFSSKVYSTGCMIPLVIHYNVYILKDPKNFVNAVANKGSPLHITKGCIGDFPYVINHRLNCEKDHLLRN